MERDVKRLDVLINVILRHGVLMETHCELDKSRSARHAIILTTCNLVLESKSLSITLIGMSSNSQVLFKEVYIAV